MKKGNKMLVTEIKPNTAFTGFSEQHITLRGAVGREALSSMAKREEKELEGIIQSKQGAEKKIVGTGTRP